MINTIADLLLELKEKEEDVIKNFRQKYPSTPHSTIIGDMYEGVANKVLEKTLFKDFDLRVVSGQITNDTGEFSNEIDCMIVEGEGDPIPNTSKFIYDISQVLAVIEVKKNLNKTDLVDSYNKMYRLSKIFNPREMSENEFRLFRDAFKNAVGFDVPSYTDLNNYSLPIQMIYRTLLIEAMMPLRIVFGFYGYKSMHSLRKGFIDLLGENVNQDSNDLIKGFGPSSLPNLIFTGNSSLIKANGMPYATTLDENEFWEVYASSNHNPLLHLLELLWTRVTYKHRISSDIFGEDLEIEVLIRYLKCRPMEVDQVLGWEYAYTELPKEFDTSPYFYNWEPKELSQAEFILLTWLCDEESMNTETREFDELIKIADTNKQSFISGLLEKRLIYIDSNCELKLLTDECAVVIKNGKFYAGENKDGKVTRWLMK